MARFSFDHRKAKGGPWLCLMKYVEFNRDSQEISPFYMLSYIINPCNSNTDAMVKALIRNYATGIYQECIYLGSEVYLK